MVKLHVALSSKAWKIGKELSMRSMPAQVSSVLKIFFDYLAGLDAYTVLDNAARSVNPINEYLHKEWRHPQVIFYGTGLAFTRNFLNHPSQFGHKMAASNVVTPRMAMLCLRFENPTVYALIKQKNLTHWIDEIIAALREELGLSPLDSEDLKAE